MSDVTDLLDTIQNDQSKALRAEKTVDGAEALTGEPRTAIRYLGETEHGQEKYRMVSTRVQSFPEGTDMRGVHGRESVAKWIEANDPEVIDAAADDGFNNEDTPEEVTA